MPFNVFANEPVAFWALATISFEAAGLTAQNTASVMLVGAPCITWIPDSAINAIDGFEARKSYVIEPLQNIDLTGLVIASIDEAQQTALPDFIEPKELDIITTPGQPVQSNFLINTKISTFARDGDVKAVITAGTPTEKQILFDYVTGTLTPAETNPFAIEDVHVVYKKIIST